MSDVRKDELIRLSARRELTPAEESQLEVYFAADPAARVEWEEERTLSRAVQSLPDVPVSSNFTSRVLQEVDREEKYTERARRTWFEKLWPKLGWATAVLLAVLLVMQYRVSQQERIIDDLVDVTRDIRRVPPEVLQDFEVIERLSQATPSDDDLLAALQ